MALKSNCDNSGTILLRWSPRWRPLITVLVITGRDRAAAGACSQPRKWHRLSRLRPGLMGCEKTSSMSSSSLIHYGLTIIDNRLEIMSLDDITPCAVFIFSCRRPRQLCRIINEQGTAEGTDMGIETQISAPSGTLSDVGPGQDLLKDSG